MSRFVGRGSHDMHSRELRQYKASRGTDLQMMHESNWLLVLNCVREHGVLPRAAVARHTGLSRTTVGNIIDELLAEGFVREGDSERAIPSGGRRVIPVHFNTDVAYILGVAVGRHRLIMLLTDLAAKIVARVEVPFPAREGPDVCLPLMANAMRDFVASQSVAWAKVIGVSIGWPGVVTQGVAVAVPPSMPGWAGTNVQQIVSELIGQPIYLDNNANLGALGETCFGNGRNVESMLYVRVGTGIGAGIVLNGHIFRGSAGSAGEIGHIVVDPHGLPCPCGNRGCLETIASKQAIIDRVARVKPEVDDIVTVLELAHKGDGACIESLEIAGEGIGAIVVGLVNFLSPMLIVIDGSTMRAGEILLRPIREAVATKSLPTPRMHTRVVAGALGKNAIALGAVAAVQNAVFGDGATLHAIAAKFQSSSAS